jgi:hypothetical protein
MKDAQAFEFSLGQHGFPAFCEAMSSLMDWKATVAQK